MNASRNYIILFNPDPRGEYRAIPYGLLYLERAVRNLEVEVVIIDGQIETNYQKRISELKGNILMCAVSAILGNQVGEGLAFSKFVKKERDVPVLWGGWFANWNPTVLLNDPAIDYVITGQGEIPFGALVKLLLDNSKPSLEQLKALPNLLFRHQGEIINNGELRPYSVKSLPAINWEYINVHDYVSTEHAVHFIASQGCPCNCSFCFLSSYWKSYWESGNIKDVIAGLQYLLAKDPEIRHISFDDSNLFADREFTMELAAFFLEYPKKLRWCGTTNIAGLLDNYSDEDLRILQEAGCETIYAGAESGDQETLDMLNKNLKPAQTLTFVRRLQKADIRVSLSFMSLYPGKTDQELKQTMKLISKIKLIDPTIKYTINLYYPSRKNKFYFLAKEQGMTPPEKISDYLDFFAGSHRLPWHTDRHYRILEYYSLIYFRFIDPAYHKHGAAQKHWLLKLCNLTAYPWVWLRFKIGVYGWNLDARILLWILRGELREELKNAETNFMTRRYKIH